MELKKCSLCNENKEISDYYQQNKKDKNGVEYVYTIPYCKECAKKKSRKWQLDNHEYYLERTSEHHKKSRRDSKERRDYDAAHSKRQRESGYYKKYMTENLAKFREYNKIRNRIKIILNVYSDREDIEGIQQECIFTFSKDCELEHFIPLSWGHGGDYIGNVYYLESSLNRKKRDRNPFEWANDMIIENEITRKDWDRFIQKISTQNDMSVREFKEYIYWCEENKRSLEELESDNTPTLTLWKNSRVK